MSTIASLLMLLVLCVPLPLSAGTILIVGDSLSASYGLPVERGWVSLLQERLQAEHGGWTVVNASISGDTTAAARARLPQAIDLHQPDVVVLALGGNDGLRGLSLQRMQENLAAMIRMVRDNQAQVLLIGVQLPPNYGPQYTRRFEAVYRELAEEQGVALLPSLVEGIGTRSELMQSDGIHPNVAAQPLMMKRVWRHLRPMLERGQARRQTPCAACPEPRGVLYGVWTDRSAFTRVSSAFGSRERCLPGGVLCPAGATHR